MTKHDRELLRSLVQEGKHTDHELKQRFGVTSTQLTAMRRSVKGMNATTQQKQRASFSKPAGGEGDDGQQDTGEATTKSEESQNTEEPTQSESDGAEDAEEDQTTQAIEYQCNACGFIFTGQPKTCPNCGDVFIWE